LPCACLTHGKIKIQEIKKSYRPAAAALLGPPPPAPAVAAPPDFRRCAHGPRPSHPWLSPRCQLRPPPAATTAAHLPSPLDLRVSRRWTVAAAPVEGSELVADLGAPGWELEAAPGRELLAAPGTELEAAPGR